jgi:hypothetical protein
MVQFGGGRAPHVRQRDGQAGRSLRTMPPMHESYGMVMLGWVQFGGLVGFSWAGPWSGSVAGRHGFSFSIFFYPFLFSCFLIPFFSILYFLFGFNHVLSDFKFMN